MTIQPIVEGDGEMEAVPALLRRLLAEGAVTGVQVGKPIKRPRNQLVREEVLTRMVRFALLRPECGAVLIILDGNSDCPKTLGPVLQGWAEAAAGRVPCAVVLAHREYEAWFLASLESLRGIRGIRREAEAHPDPEEPRDAKGELEICMEPSRAYHPTVDQPALTALFDMAQAYSRSRSFRRMVRAVELLLRAASIPIPIWPPPGWLPHVEGI
ncbi:MAG TPA: DUF4276 family protein [Candidatus Dormibacteraeota bacterium]|nr:DUF4276 family protein [Candidatus Dormibacteraeota bacterium]